MQSNCLLVTVKDFVTDSSQQQILLSTIEEQGEVLLRLEHGISLMTESDRFYQHSLLTLVGFILKKKMPWMAQVMVGGRLGHRAITSHEVWLSAVESATFAFAYKASGVILICRHMKDITEDEDISFYHPKPSDFVRILGSILDCNKDNVRLKICLLPEPLPAGAIIQGFPEAFEKLIQDFNSAPDQVSFYNQHIFPLAFRR